MKACEQGERTLFVTATALISTLGKSLAEGRLEERLKLLTPPQLLIIDEIGYLPIDRQGANLFFLVSRRHERGSIISPAIRVLAPGAKSSEMRSSPVPSSIAGCIIRSRSTLREKVSDLRRSSRPGYSNPNLTSSGRHHEH